MGGVMVQLSLLSTAHLWTRGVTATRVIKAHTKVISLHKAPNCRVEATDVTAQGSELS